MYLYLSKDSVTPTKKAQATMPGFVYNSKPNVLQMRIESALPSGYTSLHESSNLCPQEGLVDTYLCLKPPTHVLRCSFWVHISASNHHFMSPHAPSGYISLPQTTNSCPQMLLLDTYLCLKPPTHDLTCSFWIHISASNRQLMSSRTPSGYISLPQTANSCPQERLVDTYLCLKPPTHVLTCS